MKVSAVLCLQCHDLVWSRSRHDFRSCSCGECFIDGGRDYTRIGYTKVTNITMGILDLDTQLFKADTNPSTEE